MTKRSTLVRSAVGVLGGLCVSMAAFAAGVPFEAKSFEAAQAAGKPILVAVHADWCSTCRAQDPVVGALLQSPKYRGFSVYRVDFDKQKSTVKRFDARYQSTLIVFKGAKEVSRSTAQTDADLIAGQLDKAL